MKWCNASRDSTPEIQHCSVPFRQQQSIGMWFGLVSTRNSSQKAPPAPLRPTSMELTRPAHFGFNCGKRITSRMLSWPRSIMQRRSMANDQTCSPACRNASSFTASERYKPPRCSSLANNSRTDRKCPNCFVLISKLVSATQLNPSLPATERACRSSSRSQQR